MQEQQKEYCRKLENVRKQLEEATKQHEGKSSDVLYLQSELEKEQLLHQQTHSNYEQILVTYKNNVSQLQKKVKELKQSKLVAE